jgi:putative phosphoesterase
MASVKVGLIADTHGLLRPEAMEALRGSDYIVHGGDVGDPDILRALAAIAPVTAVRGNNDKGSWASSLPTTEVLPIGETLIYVVHDLADLDLDPGAAGFQAVVSGHSHRPRCESRNGVVFVNPGSSGPRRFHLPVAVARLVVSPTGIEPQVLELRVTAPASNGRRRPRAAQRGSS